MLYLFLVQWPNNHDIYWLATKTQETATCPTSGRQSYVGVQNSDIMQSYVFIIYFFLYITNPKPYCLIDLEFAGEY